MAIIGSVDNGDTDTECTVNPDRRILVEVDDKGVAHVVSTPNDKRLDEQDKRISALELQVHRLLNEQPQVPEADYAHIPAAEWEDICAELEALRTQQAQAPDVPMLRRMITALHKSGSESIEEIVRLSSELSELRSQRPNMDEHGVHLSHDAYDMLEREAAIGRSVPWKAIDTYRWTGEDGPVIWEWYAAHAPKEPAE